LSYYGIPTPRFQIFGDLRQKLNPELKFPLIVKPEAEGSSIGITNNSLVFDISSLKKQVDHVIKNYSQNALVEEYCEGREFTIGLLGNNGRVRILPIVEIDFSHLPDHLHKFESYESKWIYDNPKDSIDPIICPANIKIGLKAQLERLSQRTFLKLGCVDFCRIDVRLDSNGIPNILDVNALPGLMPDPKSNSRFTRSCYALGMTYNEMILEILNAALKRCGLLS
ncbi:ATP-grasp domain-containing protein, partial [bacterium]|nr:ATP-grasp domain-containing protein [bacterium]